jgi:hypothetical protein
MELFPKNHVIPMSKVLTFYRTEPFHLEAKYTHIKDINNSAISLWDQVTVWRDDNDARFVLDQNA